MPWTALVRERSCLQHLMLLNIWVEFQFRIIHYSTSWEIPLQCVKVLCWLDQRDNFPVCIPSAILCAKVQCLVPIWCLPCLRWRVHLGEVPWRYLTRPIRTATVWSPAGIFIHWSGGYRSDANDADDGDWNPLLFEWAEVQKSPCTSANRLFLWSCKYGCCEVAPHVEESLTLATLKTSLA